MSTEEATNLAEGSAGSSEPYAFGSGYLPTSRRGQRTQRKLLEGAQRAFERLGFLNTRVVDIAEEAGVAHGSFYTYYESKDEIFQRLIEFKVQELLGTPLDHGETHSPLERIEHANRDYLEAFQRNARLMILWEQVSWINPDVRRLLIESRAPFYERTVRSISNLQKAGLVDPDLRPDYAARALTGMVNSWVLTWFADGQEVDLEDSVQVLTRMWANAIGLRSSPTEGAEP